MNEPLRNLAIPVPHDHFVVRVRDRVNALLADVECDLLIIALSGGPDSLALLAALAAGAVGQPALLVGHVNHALRGIESDEDEWFCTQLCSQWRIPFATIRLSGNISDENSLRLKRYEFFRELSGNRSRAAVLTGHTFDDQVETLFFRLLRGTSPAGLRGIPVKRPISPGSKTLLIRPMLEITRQEVLAFIERSNLQFRSDSSNAETRYSRNFIRNELFPLIAERFPQFMARAEQFRVLLDEDMCALDQLVEEAENAIRANPIEAVSGTKLHGSFNNEAAVPGSQGAMECWSRPAFLELQAAIQRRLVVRKLREHAVEASSELVERVCVAIRKGTGAISLSYGCQLLCDSMRVRWSRKQPSRGRIECNAAPVQLENPGVTLAQAFGVAITIEVVEQNALVTGKDQVSSERDDRAQAHLEFPSASAMEALVDLTAVQPAVLQIRIRQPGDLIQPFGMQEMVRLKKFLHTRKSPKLQIRRETIVVANGNEVLWVPGIGLSEKLRVHGNPTHRISVAEIANSPAEL